MMSSCCCTLMNCGNRINPEIAVTQTKAATSASRPRTGCHSASSSHQAIRNSSTMTPPVMCTDITPTSASTAAGMRSRCRRVEVISTNVGIATP